MGYWRWLFEKLRTAWKEDEEARLLMTFLIIVVTPFFIGASIAFCIDELIGVIIALSGWLLSPFILLYQKYKKELLESLENL